MTQPQVDRPTVVVHVTDGGILEVVCADAPVCVICVDYGVDRGDANSVAPDGDHALMWEVVFGNPAIHSPVNPEQVAEYEHALAAGEEALSDDE